MRVRKAHPTPLASLATLPPGEGEACALAAPTIPARTITRERSHLAFADLFQNLSRVLAEPRGRALRRHRLAIDHDRRADAGDRAQLGEGAWQIELHAAMLDVRVV